MDRQPAAKRAVQYLRMSTEQQDYSLSYQAEAIARYAAVNGLEIVRTYADEGISGLGIEKRLALQQLLADAINATGEFEVILVFDVSRWGRFQNPDQAAHYEFICEEAGVRVEYCAEAFHNDGSPAAALMKHVKRAMAAEYSRELSSRVTKAKHGLRAMGYWMGSQPGYGFRREAIRDGKRIALCEAGVWARQPGAHVRITKGPLHELKTVAWIYRSYLAPDGSCQAISSELNRRGVPGEGGAGWTPPRVCTILTNPKYRGRAECGRLRVPLVGPKIMVPEDEWVVVPGAFPALVSARLFNQVAAKFESRRRRPTDADLIEELKRLWAQHGVLSSRIVDKEGCYSVELYRKRFGGLLPAYAAAGYTQTEAQFRHTERFRPFKHPPTKYTYSDDALLGFLRALLAKYGRLGTVLIDTEPGVPAASTFSIRFGSIVRAYEAIGYQPNAKQIQLKERWERRAADRARTTATP